MGNFFTKLRLFFSKVLFIINTIFSPLPETLLAGCGELFAEASEFIMYALLQLVVLGTAVSTEYFLQRTKRRKSEGAKPGV
jgi:hypothetical protein